MASSPPITSLERPETDARVAPARGVLPLPPWVGRLVDPGRRESVPAGSDVVVQVQDAGRYGLATVVVRGAALMDAPTLQRLTTQAYRAVTSVCTERRAHHPVRFWNFIPDIRAQHEDGLDHYMAFNAGRFAAFSEGYGDLDAFDHRVATATGVGHDGVDLVIHALNCETPGIHLQNPRQTRPYRYSRRYGPSPPCFARATIVREERDGDALIMIGGTASVRGEESVHIGDLDAQLTETFNNMSRLLHVAYEKSGESNVPENAERLLRRFRDLRVYFVRNEDLTRLRECIARRLPHLDDVEFIRADICRSALLVEIEGTALAKPER